MKTRSFGKNKGKLKSQKQIPKNKISLELLYQILGHRSKRSLMDGDTANFCHDIELRVDLYPFYTSCHISTINKRLDQKQL